MNLPDRRDRERLTAYQVILLVLSVLVLVALVVDTVAPISPEASTAIQRVDTVVCGIFAIDVVVRFRRAPNKVAFLRWGWIDVLACIPNIDLLRTARLVRVLRILRLLRGLRVGHRGLSILLRNQPRDAFASVGLAMLLLTAFASVAILVAEQGPDANIRTAGDALWWSVSTITTVGYGDRFPTTPEGRVIAMILMISGVGLFGTLSGIVASLFLGANPDREPNSNRELMERLRVLEAKLDALAGLVATAGSAGSSPAGPPREPPV